MPFRNGADVNRSYWTNENPTLSVHLWPQMQNYPNLIRSIIVINATYQKLYSNEDNILQKQYDLKNNSYCISWETIVSKLGNVQCVQCQVTRWLFSQSLKIGSLQFFCKSLHYSVIFLPLSNQGSLCAQRTLQLSDLELNIAH